MTASTEVVPARINQPPFVNNLLVNPGFEIWQRGAGPFTADNAGSADEWWIDYGSGESLSVQRDSNAKFGAYCLSATSTGTTLIEQGIEAYKSLEDRWLTFSCWVKTSDVDSVRLWISDHTSASSEVEEGAYHSGSNQWELLVVTKKIRTGLVTDIDVPHAFGLRVSLRFDLDASALFDGAVLAAGYFPEGIPYVPLHPAEDLERCLRFYQTLEATYDSPVWSGVTSNGSKYDRPHQYATTMRATPTISHVTGGQSAFPAGSPTYLPGPRGLWMRKTANANDNNGYHWSRYNAEVT